MARQAQASAGRADARDGGDERPAVKEMAAPAVKSQADTALRGRLRDLANERRRFGHRRLFVLLRREGELSGIDRIHRLHSEEGLSLHERRTRRKAIGTRAPILIRARANARWSLDFVHDQCACGRRFGLLNVVNDVTRDGPAAIPDTSIAGRRVARDDRQRRGTELTAGLRSWLDE